MVCGICLWWPHLCSKSHTRAHMFFTVHMNCTEAPDDTQCYTVSFNRSVFEGYDTSISPESGKKFFLFSVYSNTPYTSLLGGYEVLFAVSCSNSANITANQLSTQELESCDAAVVSSWCNETTYMSRHFFLGFSQAPSSQQLYTDTPIVYSFKTKRRFNIGHIECFYTANYCVVVSTACVFAVCCTLPRTVTYTCKPLALQNNVSFTP